jgi:hypothetical protein
VGWNRESIGPLSLLKAVKQSADGIVVTDTEGKILRQSSRCNPFEAHIPIGRCAPLCGADFLSAFTEKTRLNLIFPS